MLPAFRQTVEELFVKGLVRAVFATETLALGINMPARTVVLERLVKYNGEAHAELTPGEYTQLTGRAGRRGIDIEGHAVVLWQPGVEPVDVAGLASTRTFPLRSSFRPGYNMTINLVDRMGAAESRALLERSFAQFQADRSVVGLTRGIERNEAALHHAPRTAGRRGRRVLRVRAPAGGTEQPGTVTRTGRSNRTPGRRRRLARRTAARRRDRDPGGTALGSGRGAGTGPGTPGSEAADPHRGEVGGPGVGRRLPGARTVFGIDAVAAALRSSHRPGATRSGIGVAQHRNRRAGTPEAEEVGCCTDDAEIARLRRAIRQHPCHSWPDREQLSRIGERYNRLARETETMRQKVAATTNSLARTFDRILSLLAERDYISPGEHPDATEHGTRLSRIYCESDLLVAECLRQGVWKGLGPAELAAVVSAVIFESRREGDTVEGGGPGALRHALDETVRVWRELRADEIRHKLPPTREPDLGFAAAIFHWASDNSLVEALIAAGDQGRALSAGDFVRWCRQVIDLLEQVRSTSPDPQVGKAAGRAVAAIRRGVVAVDAA